MTFLPTAYEIERWDFFFFFQLPYPSVFFSRKTNRWCKEKDEEKKNCLHLVRRLGWIWWEISFSEAATKHRSIREEVIFLLILPPNLSETCVPLTLTHLSLFLFPHCKKNSGSEALQALWFLSSVSISKTKANRILSVCLSSKTQKKKPKAIDKIQVGKKKCEFSKEPTWISFVGLRTEREKSGFFFIFFLLCWNRVPLVYSKTENPEEENLKRNKISNLEIYDSNRQIESKSLWTHPAIQGTDWLRQWNHHKS